MQPFLVKNALELFDNNQSRFAEAIGTTQQNVSNWVRKSKPLPAQFVRAAEKATGISRYRWRPDIFGTEQEALAAALSTDSQSGASAT